MAASTTAQRQRVETRRRRKICTLDGVTLAGPDMGAHGIRQTRKCQRVSVVNPQGMGKKKRGRTLLRPHLRTSALNLLFSDWQFNSLHTVDCRSVAHNGIK